jgi:hypothetical protein
MSVKTGAGRTTTGAPKVADVETLPCPRGGLHRLANSAERGGLVTACRDCRKSWAELDAEARAGLAPVRETEPIERTCTSCHRGVIGQSTWTDADAAQRKAWAAEGKAMIQGRGLCRPCYLRERRRSA